MEVPFYPYSCKKGDDLFLVGSAEDRQVAKVVWRTVQGFKGDSTTQSLSLDSRDKLVGYADSRGKDPKVDPLWKFEELSENFAQVETL